MTDTQNDDPGFGSILVPSDGSDRSETAVVPALALARAANVPIVFIRSEADLDEVDAAAASLRELAVRYGGDAETDTVVVTSDQGSVGEALVKEATNRRGLICMASHGRTRVGKAVLGSVAADVLSLSSSPVLVVGPEHHPERELIGRRLGVCLDGSRFAEEILPVAARWATVFGLHLWLLESASPAELADLAQAPPDDAVESSYVANIARKLPGKANWDVLHARQPVDAIVAYAEEQPVGVLAMATHGRRGWARMAEGSVALQVLHRAPCPVLIVHPADVAKKAARRP
jgi:nucleotide-binding universal stress UspA family protein